MLQRRIEGVPNFRRVPMVLRPVHSGNSSSDEESGFVVEGDGKMVCGWSVILRIIFGNSYLSFMCISGMPTLEG